MQKTLALKVVGSDWQISTSLLVKPGLTVSAIANRLGIPRACIFKISKGTGILLDPESEVAPLMGDGDELLVLLLNFVPKVAGGRLGWKERIANFLSS